jgi:hypothetical protein
LNTLGLNTAGSMLPASTPGLCVNI